MRFRTVVTVGDSIFGVSFCYSSFVRGFLMKMPNERTLLAKVKFYDQPARLTYPGSQHFTLEDAILVKELEKTAVGITSGDLYAFLLKNKDTL